MLKLMWIQDAGPECWNLDILDVFEARLGDWRLELLQMSCLLLPKLFWTVSHKPCHFAIPATSPATLPSFVLTIA